MKRISASCGLPPLSAEDFTQVANSAIVIVARKDFAAKGLQDIIAMAKAKPGSVNVAIAGATGEIAVNVFKRQAGIDANNVNYKGGTPAVFAVIAGEAQINLANYSTIAQLVEGGKLIGAIGVSGGTGSQDEGAAKAGAAVVK